MMREEEQRCGHTVINWTNFVQVITLTSLFNMNEDDGVDDNSSVPYTSARSCSPEFGSPATASTLTNSTYTQQPEEPEPKRSRVVEMLAYPAAEDIPWPSRGLIESLFNEAVQECPDGDQQYLQDAGLLSFEQVILPALAYQEEQALKKLQAKTQRDHPELKNCVVQARKAVYGAVGAACRAVHENKARRVDQQAQREAAWLQQEEEKAKQAREKAEQQRHAALQQHKRELKMKLPANQSLWREEAYLMTQISKLKLEEQQWIDAEALLLQQEAALEAEEQKLEAEKAQEAEQRAAATQESSDQEPTIPPEVLQIAETANDIRMSAKRIENALKVVANTVEQTEQARQALYKQYCKDHQFHGYPSVDNPKGLLSALSQSQQPLSQASSMDG